MKGFFVVFGLLLAWQLSIGNSNISYARHETESGTSLSSAPELILQTGHSKVVQAVAFSPDKRYLASGSFDSTIKIWDVETGSELRSLSGHLGAVKALVWSPDGKWLVSGGNDRTLRIWDVNSGQEARKFDEGDSTIEAIAVSGDGSMVASGGSGNKITVREVATGKATFNLEDHKSPITAIAFSPDGSVLASGSEDERVITWDLKKGELDETLKGHVGAITELRFDRSGQVLASGGVDKTVRLWNAANGRKLGTLSGHEGSILALEFTSPASLSTIDTTRTIKRWNITDKPAVLSTIKLDQEAAAGEAESGSFSANETALAIGNGAGTVTIYDPANSAAVRQLENYTVGYYAARFSADRHWLATASFDNTVKLWDLQTGRALSPFTGHTGRVTTLVFHPDNKRVISASVDHTIRIWDTSTGRSVEVLKGHTNGISSLAISRNGKYLVSASADQTIGIWDLEAKTTPRFLRGHTGEVISVSISPADDLIASSGIDGTVKIWDIATGNNSRSFDPRSGEIDSVSFSPDGKTIVSGGIDRTIRIWDTASGTPLKTLSGHTGKINSIAFSSDGRQLASSGQDKTVRIWDIATGGDPRVINGHAGAVFSAEYTTDGQFIASASDDGSVNIWKAIDGGLLTTLISLKNSDDWLVVSPQGFFDGSPASWGQLSWRFEKSTFNVQPIEVFFNEFYSPGLLADLISGEKLPSASTISDKDRRQPQVRLSIADDQTVTPGQRNVKVNITVSQAPAGAEDVRLFRNGALVKVWRGDVLKGSQSAMLSAVLPVVAGENLLTAYAFNRDDIKSSDAVLVVNGSKNQTREPVGYLLTVGINKYANSEYDLKFAVPDAQDFAGETKRRQSQLKNYSRIEVVALSDAAATKANILQSLTDLASKVQPEDALIIYFAGHGIADNDRFYLIPHDIGYEGSRSQLNKTGLQQILSHGISDQELESAVERIDAGRLLMVIDACNSGQALESKEKRLGPMNSKGLAQLAYEKGMYILTAAQSYQVALEAEKLGHGFLTYALVEEGLRTPAADNNPKDGQVLLREWLDFATARVPQIRENDLKTRELQREKTKESEKAAEMRIQRPRVFYRREAESYPLVVARH